MTTRLYYINKILCVPQVHYNKIVEKANQDLMKSLDHWCGLLTFSNLIFFIPLCKSQRLPKTERKGTK